MTSVCVIGSGPSGLLAAWAAELSGAVDVLAVISPGRRASRIGGAMYLHRQIPGMDNTPDMVTYKLLGTPEGYRERVYGEAFPSVQVSPESLEGTHIAYDMRAAYGRLWARYYELLNDDRVGAGKLEAMLPSFDLIVLAAPLPAFCRRPEAHAFRTQQVWGMEKAIIEVPPQTVVCNGSEDYSWYRVANLFGSRTTEWPYRTRPPFPVDEIQKPIYTTCDCWQETGKVLRVGRYGTWTKGVLAHQAYEAVTAWLSQS
jgi:hypothetical protein